MVWTADYDILLYKSPSSGYIYNYILDGWTADYDNFII